jgi:outer membrane receptor protein involved in Fe transport/urease accessory protein UreE
MDIRDDSIHLQAVMRMRRIHGRSHKLGTALILLWLSITLPAAAENWLIPSQSPEPTRSSKPANSADTQVNEDLSKYRGPLRRFDLEAGDASEQLNEFSRQSDLQVLFDFERLKGMKTRAVSGEMKAADALERMLAGTVLVFDFVNEHTLAVTPKKPSALSRLAHRLTTRHRKAVTPDDGLDEILVSRQYGNAATAAIGGEQLTLGRVEIERSGAATTEDYLHTFPQIWPGGVSKDTVLGREQMTNVAHGAGINLRGLDAGATLVLIDGKRVAPSGSAAAFFDTTLIPLAMVEGIELLPDGSSAQYGSDAVSGVVNFRLRTAFQGSETQVLYGGVTEGPTKRRLASELLGKDWERGNGVLAVEYFQQDFVLASSRAQATSNLTGFGGDNFDSLYANPGTLLVNGTYYALPHGQNGVGIYPSSLVPNTQNFTDLWSGASVLPKERRLSAMGSVRQEVGEQTSLFVDVLAGDRSIQSLAPGYGLALSVGPSNPWYVNPAGGTAPVTVLYNFERDLGPLATDADVRFLNVTTGVEWAAGHGWKVRASAGYSLDHERQTIQGFANPNAVAAAVDDPNPATAFNPFGEGSNTAPATLDAIRATARYAGNSALKLFQVQGGGPIFELPGGDIKFTAGLEYRDLTFDSTVVPSDGTVEPRSDVARHVTAGFAEARVPLVSADNDIPGLRRLEFSAAIRHEQYSDVGGATTPQFGWIFSPFEPIALRGTWSKSFRAPNLSDRLETNNASGIVNLPDPSSPSGQVTTLVWAGNNADLQAEHGRTWTIGADFKSEHLPGLSFGLTYFDTHLVNRVDITPFSFGALEPAEQSLYAAFITRNPSSAQQAQVCGRSTFQGLNSTCLNAPIGAILDVRLHNDTSVITRGIDFNAEYKVPKVPGQLTLGLLATNLLQYSRANTAQGPLQDLLNTEHEPIDWRLRGTASWDYRGLGVVGSLNYTDSYRQFPTDNTRTVASWTTADLRVAYHFGDDPAQGAQVALNIENLFNALPPYLNNPVGVGYDQENGDLLGRMVSLSITYRWK